MIEREDFGNFEVTCDKCGESVTIDADGDFSYVISEIKRMGWCVRKVFGKWMHICQDCA